MSTTNHTIEVRHQIDGDYSSYWAFCYWAFCSCGWRDRVGHNTRKAAEDAGDDHVLAAI